MSPQIEFGCNLGPASNWGPIERRIATAGIMAHLLQPLDEELRHGVRRVLLAADLKVLEKNIQLEPEKGQLLEGIKAELISDLQNIARRRSSKTYANALRFNLDHKDPGRRSGSKLRGILAAGLIVNLANQDARPREEQSYGPDAAKVTISKSFKKNALFERNNTGLTRAWRRNRPVAHLAAALLYYICDHSLRRFRTAEQRVWRAGIVEFLEYANYFQHYIHEWHKQPKVRFTYDLIELPADWGLARKEPESPITLPLDIGV